MEVGSGETGKAKADVRKQIKKTSIKLKTAAGHGAGKKSHSNSVQSKEME